MQANDDSAQTLIWAYSDAPVSEAGTDAPIMHHIASGTCNLNLKNNAGSLNPVDMKSSSTSTSISESSSPAATSTSTWLSMSASKTTTSESNPTHSGAATSLNSLSKNTLLGGMLSIAVFAPFF
jgi:hypothetical protein